MSDEPFTIDVTAETFDRDVIEHSRQVPVLVDFWASWCGPCQMLMPVLTRLAEAYEGRFVLAKVNIDEQQELAVRFGVRSVPTVLLFRHGEAVDQFLGAQPESEIRTLLDRYIERESDHRMAQALELFAQGQQSEAISALRSALDEEPENYRARVALAEMLLNADQYAESEEILRGLPADVGTDEHVIRLWGRLEFSRSASKAPPMEELEGALERDPSNSEARYLLAARHVASGDYEPAMQLLLELVRRDRSFGDDAGRKGLLKIFDLLGGQGELVTRYRSRMFNALH